MAKKVTKARPGSKCTYGVFVSRASEPENCGLPAVVNVNNKPRCSAHAPKNWEQKLKQPGGIIRDGLGETSDAAAISP